MIDERGIRLQEESSKLERFFMPYELNDTINIFVHGFSNGKKEDQNKIIDDLISSKLSDTSYLYRWPSGSLGQALKRGAKRGAIAGRGRPKRTVILAAGGAIIESVSHFTKKRKLAEAYSKDLYRRVSRKKNIRSYKINLIGHSLGSFIIVNSLKHSFNGWSGMKINNVVLMGGAVDYEDYAGEWADIVSLAQGRFFNVWCPEDFALTGDAFTRGSLKKRIGQSKIPSKIKKVHNISMGSGWQHEDYWPQYLKVYKKTIARYNIT